jgi:deoxycytidylate deaminase
MIDSIVRTADASHQHFLRFAYAKADADSTDPSTRVGAVLVRETSRGVYYVSHGVNQLRRDVEGTFNLSFPELRNISLDREFKINGTDHAERVSIEHARALGAETEGLHMYMPWLPCESCAKELVGAGIERLVGHEQLVVRTPDRWQSYLEEGLDILEAGGVEVLLYNGIIGGVSHLFNGEVWLP